MVTAAAFLDLLPQFGDSGVSVTTIEAWLTTAAADIGPEYGADQDRATYWLAAHKMSLSGIGPHGAAGAFVGIKSINSGALSFTKDDKFGDYGLTPYGRDFFPIWRSVRSGPFVTGTGSLPSYVAPLTPVFDA